jgi:hypothetical protein
MAIILFSLLILFSAFSVWFLNNSRRAYSNETISKIDAFTSLDRRYNSILLSGILVVCIMLWLFNIDFDKLYLLFILLYSIASLVIIYTLIVIKFKGDGVPASYERSYIILNILKIVLLFQTLLIIHKGTSYMYLT